MALNKNYNIKSSHRATICNSTALTKNQCANFTDNKVILLQERGKKYRIINTREEQFVKIKLDGCLSPVGQETADYLVLHCKKNDAYIVELKGSDFTKACTQILSSIRFLQKEIHNARIHARIVLGKVRIPALPSEQFMRLKQICLSHGGDCKYRSQTFTETLA